VKLHNVLLRERQLPCIPHQGYGVVLLYRANEMWMYTFGRRQLKTA
jgi:hypothetical protein